MKTEEQDLSLKNREKNRDRKSEPVRKTRQYPPYELMGREFGYLSQSGYEARIREHMKKVRE